jgi:hypothetical protein
VANGDRRYMPQPCMDMGIGKIVQHGPTSKESAVKKERKPRGPNKTELRFRQEMLPGFAIRDGIYQKIIFEGLRLKLTDGVIYVPDWVVISPTNNVWCFEVKGAFIRNPGRARTKFFVAREQWPCFRFEAWQYLGKKEGWKEIWL